MFIILLLTVESIILFLGVLVLFYKVLVNVHVIITKSYFVLIVKVKLLVDECPNICLKDQGL